MKAKFFTIGCILTGALALSGCSKSNSSDDNKTTVEHASMIIEETEDETTASQSELKDYETVAGLVVEAAFYGNQDTLMDLLLPEAFYEGMVEYYAEDGFEYTVDEVKEQMASNFTVNDDLSELEYVINSSRKATDDETSEIDNSVGFTYMNVEIEEAYVVEISAMYAVGMEATKEELSVYSYKSDGAWYAMLM